MVYGGTFQEIYVKKCTDLGVHLNSAQVSALESTIADIFSSRSKTTEPILEGHLYEQTIDKETLIQSCKQSSYPLGRVLSVLNRYATGTVAIQREPTNRDALELYEQTKAAIGLTHARLPILTRIQTRKSGKYMRNYGIKCFKVLERYLTLKGIQEQPKIDEKPQT